MWCVIIAALEREGAQKTLNPAFSELMELPLWPVRTQGTWLVQQSFQYPTPILQQGFPQSAFKLGHIPTSRDFELLLGQRNEGFGLAEYVGQQRQGFFLLSGVERARVISMVISAYSLASSSNRWYCSTSARS